MEQPRLTLEPSTEGILRSETLRELAQHAEGVRGFFGMCRVAIDKEAGVVVKVPMTKLPRLAVFKEAMTVAIVQDAIDTAPLRLPTVVDVSDNKPPYYVALRYIDGETMNLGQAQDLLQAEQYNLGKRVGNFVAWMADTVSQDEYHTSVRSVIGQQLPESELRLNMLQQRLWYREDNGIVWPTGLTDCIADIWENQGVLFSENDLRTIIGHRDLRPDNFTFAKDDDCRWVLDGIFDFGYTGQTNPEFELRHLLAIGEAALQGGIDAYQQASDEILDLEVLRFYSQLQAVNVMTNRLRKGPDALETHHYQALANTFPNQQVIPLSQQG